MGNKYVEFRIVKNGEGKYSIQGKKIDIEIKSKWLRPFLVLKEKWEFIYIENAFDVAFYYDVKVIPHKYNSIKDARAALNKYIEVNLIYKTSADTLNDREEWEAVDYKISDNKK